MKYTLYIGTVYTWDLSGTNPTAAKNAEKKENGINHNHIFRKRFWNLYNIYIYVSMWKLYF